MADWFSFPKYTPPAIPTVAPVIVVTTGGVPLPPTPPLPSIGPPALPGMTVTGEAPTTIIIPWYKTPLGIGALFVGVMGAWFALKKK